MKKKLTGKSLKTKPIRKKEEDLARQKYQWDTHQYASHKNVFVYFI